MTGMVDDREPETKLTFALNTKKSNHLIVGLRLKIGGSQHKGQIKFRVMERDAVAVAHGDCFWYDIALTDVEAIYGSQN